MGMFGFGNMIAAGINQVTQWGSDYWNTKSNKKAATQAYERNLADWLMQTEYNKPENQMKRLKEAGLNPNLIYGDVSNSAGSVSSAPVANVKGFSPLSAVSDYLSLEQQDAMTQQIAAQTKLIKAQAKALVLENAENTENGTSRATPYPVKLGKSVVNSAVKSIKSLSAPLSIQQSRAVDSVQKKLGVNYFDGFFNKLSGRDWNYGSKSLSEQRKIYQRDLVRQKGWSR